MSTEPTPAFRVERDTLGEMQVPADAYYAAQTARAVANFPISGLTLPPEMIAAMAAIKWAAADTNAALGMIPADKAAAIVQAAREIRDGGLRDRTLYLATVASQTSWPKRASSDWILGTPQVGFSRDIWRISSRTSASILGRPGRL